MTCHHADQRKRRIPAHKLTSERVTTRILIEHIVAVEGVVPTLYHAKPDPRNVKACHGQDGIGHHSVLACFVGATCTRHLCNKCSPCTCENEPNVEKNGNEQEDCHAELVAVERRHHMTDVERVIDFDFHSKLLRSQSIQYEIWRLRSVSCIAPHIDLKFESVLT